MGEIKCEVQLSQDDLQACVDNAKEEVYKKLKSCVKVARNEGFKNGFTIARDMAMEMLCDSCEDRCNSCHSSECEKFKKVSDKFDAVLTMATSIKGTL